MIDEIKELAAALSKAQGEVENAKKTTANPFFKSKYADLATIWDVIRETFAKHGLSVLQLPCEAPDGKIGLVTHVLHSSGQSITERFFVGLKDASNPQQVGSALTYMKRYALLGVAGIAAEDDDAEAAVGRKAVAKPGPTAAELAAIVTETMDKLAAANDQDARQLYATVRNSAMQQPAKDELLLRMAASIQARKKEQ